MQLFIWTPGLCMEVTDITLLDGCIPSVADGNHGIPLGQLPKIEPAVWFKVLILEEISIDCGQKVVMWTFKNPPASMLDQESQASDELPGKRGTRRSVIGSGAPHGAIRRSRIPGASRPHSRLVRQHLSESVYEDGEFVADDMEEVFVTLKKITRSYVEGIFDLPRLHEEILRLLHRFILPAISLKPEHLQLLMSVHSKQQKSIQDIDAAITTKNRKIGIVHQCLNRHLTKFAEHILQHDPQKLNINLDFAEMLNADIEKEIQSMKKRMKIDSEQLCKNVAQPVTDKKTVDVEKKVQGEHHNQQHVFLQVNKVLGDYIKQKSNKLILSLGRKSSADAVVEGPLRDVYQEMKNKIHEMRSEYQELVDKKVLMISVLRAISNGMADLQVSPGTVGTESDKLAAGKSTDVLLLSTISPDWLNLEGKLARLLSDTTHPLTIKYNKLCADIIEICQGAINGKAISDMSLSESYKWSLSIPCSSIDRQETPTQEESGDDLAKADAMTYSDCDFWIAEDDLTGVNSPEFPKHAAMFDAKEIYCLRAISHLKYLVTKHLEKMTILLSQELCYEIGVRGVDRVQLRYESHIYQQTFGELISLYRAAYNQLHSSISQNLSALSLKDLNLQDSFVAKMVEGKPKKISEMKTDSQGSKDEGDLADVGATADSQPLEASPQHAGSAGQSPDEGDNIPVGVKRFGHRNRSSVRVHFTCPAFRASVRRRTTRDNADRSDNTHPPEVDDRRAHLSDKDIRIKVLPEYLKTFQKACDTLKSTIDEKIPLFKFRYLKDCVYHLAEEIGQIEGKDVSSNDILDFIVVLLLQEQAAPDTPELYLHIILLDDLIPKCLELGTFCYSLMKFRIAFEYIIECIDKKSQHIETVL